ncbi:CDP-diacylglycerol--glycerol-3-phosphate 3-phosphatidyltransferase [Actinomyces sp. B33]|uniref:CDP-diacylglycerol--glycerol-3-phosphate 3-phosphatidyltransferase n=1 Tax=Actinomyces sp. B33 TaxID=2942131 RepID=UPI00233F8E0D|nr:CDP-diacylglycerol--glycerol-3-phosphate 3-phosphatidyltransferase [Actinomyces sp. B33]MDC4233049.1 CDP-diacylglycerol--glycerol-3-phosphate 3-phosphatidyltransferase [Actinomyces sp. B33]
MEPTETRSDRHRSASQVNVPNALTLLRLVLVPVFVLVKLQPTWGMQWAALGIFAVAALTDKLDGHIARSQGLVTDFGKLADPVADKALTLSAFVLLSVEETLPWWLTGLVAVRELGITVWRSVLARRGVVVAANSGGKAKTLVQMLALGTLLIPWGHFVVMNEANRGWATVMTYAGLALAGVALAVTLWSGAVYVYEGVRSSRVSQRDEGREKTDLESA